MNNTKIFKYEDEFTPRDLDKLQKPAISVSLLIFSINKGKLEIALVQRVRPPYKDMYSLPGDIIYLDESLRNAAERVLYEKTGINDVYLEQLFTFGEVERDPRGRVITVGYYALLPHNSVDLSKAPAELHACWMPVDDLPQLAFDHKKIIDYAVKRIKVRMEHSNIAHALLSEKFRLYDLQRVYEIILGETLDKRNFRKKMQSLGVIEPTGEIYREGNHRPAKLYRFKSLQLVMYD